jgi:predicted transposase YbfD/YdcC
MPNESPKDVSEKTSLFTFHTSFSTLSDPRRTNKGHLVYPLEEILFLTISACVSGANCWTGIQSFGEEKLDWLRKFFPYNAGIPSHDTISDLFILLSPTAFGTCFMDWINTIHQLTGGQVVAIDGKTVRGALSNGGKKSALHIVSAYASMQRICLGQVAVDEKSNEITAIPRILDLLTLEGCIVTTDAMGCQKDIAAKIISKQADYILMVKDNQPGLKEQIVKVFDRKEGIKSTENVDFGHGRIETRRCDVTSCLKFLDGKEDWKGLRSVVRISSERLNKKTGKSSTEERFYITSLQDDPELLNTSIRSHWAIENNLHWNLDVIFREDGQLKRAGNSAQNFNIISKIALAMIDAEKSTKDSKPNKRIRAACSDRFRELVLKV